MLRYHRTSILDSDAQTVVNTVNTVGVMGKGLALHFKKKFPGMFERYQELCKSDKLHVGALWLWKSDNQWVLNFPTKKHWRNPSKLEYIEAGLRNFADTYARRGIREIAFPRLGCGNGGLNWSDVRPLMEKYLSTLPIDVYVHDFEVDIGVPEHRDESDSTHLVDFKRFNIDIKSSVMRHKGQFFTFESNKPYALSVDEEGGIAILRSSKSSRIPQDEMFEIWTLLNKGPVTRRKLSGVAHREAYYLFPVLASLPYIRPIQLGFRDETAAIGVEFLDGKIEKRSVNAKQGELGWE